MRPFRDNDFCFVLIFDSAARLVGWYRSEKFSWVRQILNLKNKSLFIIKNVSFLWLDCKMPHDRNKSTIQRRLKETSNHIEKLLNKIITYSHEIFRENAAAQ